VAIGEEPDRGAREGRLSSRGALESEGAGALLCCEARDVGAQDGLKEGRELARGDRAEEGARGGAYGAERSGSHRREGEESGSEGRASGAREGEGATIRQSLPLARAEGESEGRGALGLGSSASLEAKEHGEAREAGSGSGIEHPEIVGVPIDALQESLSAVLIAKEERGGELLSLGEENWHGYREAVLCSVDRSRGGSLLIGGEGGRNVHARLTSGDQARAAEQGSLRVVVERKEGDRAKRLRERMEAAREGRAEQQREGLSLLRGEREAKPGLLPWEFLSPIEAKREGEAKASSLAVGEACGP
jgi:hypothetical protein